eukprot:XP_001689906.1 predicted protein [Chlamydomonas reinhardtii]
MHAAQSMTACQACFHALLCVTSCEGGCAAGEDTCKQRTAVFVWPRRERSQGRR